MSIISVKDVSFSYNEKKLGLKNVNIEIKKGEWIAILGHNGSGKSTLAKTLVGLLEPQSGEILIDQVLLNDESAYELRKKIGIVFQNPDNQFVGVTVRDDIAFGMENLCIPREEMLEKIDFYAQKVGMKEYLDKQPSNLSGGQKQRVAIAGILAMHSDILIFDEATSMLDPYTRSDLIEYIKTLNKEGLTIIMITHDVNEALLADRMLILNQGEVYAFEATNDLLKKPEVFRECHLELPVALEVASKVESQKIKEKLWEYVLTK
ncbi:MAG: energy-coupling factor transporter ATPase [Tenericutes bacterium]|nr:energy-coupling factor transporter ATPase [Mycoplasmatota bacterium]